MSHRLLRVLADLLLAGLVYVRIAPQVLSLRWIEQSRNSGPTRSARAHADKPLIAMSVGSPRSVLAVGAAAEALGASSDFELINPFDHPRTIISNFEAAEALLKHFLSMSVGQTFLPPTPRMVMHPLERLEGGLTDVERTALTEVGRSAGARSVRIWVGRELSDFDVIRTFDPE